MKDPLSMARDTGRRRYASAKDNVDDVALVVRRILDDRRTRDAVRDLVMAGRNVSDELRRDGGKRVVRHLTHRGRLTSDIEGSARALKRAANKMARARARERRQHTARVMGALMMMGSLGLAAWKALGARRRWSSPYEDGATQWAAEAAGKSPSGVDRPAGTPVRTS